MVTRPITLQLTLYLARAEAARPPESDPRVVVWRQQMALAMAALERGDGRAAKRALISAIARGV